jgi:hypothetical protein
MTKRVTLYSPMINLSHQRVDAKLSFSANYEQLVTGDGSEAHLKKCLLEALLKEAKEEGSALTETLTSAGWNFVVEPGIVLSDKFKHNGPGGLDFTEVKRIPGLEEFCKGRGIEIGVESKHEKES